MIKDKFNREKSGLKWCTDRSVKQRIGRKITLWVWQKWLRWKSGIKREDNKQNEYIRCRIEVVSISDKNIENRLRRQRNVLWWVRTSAVKVLKGICVTGKRGRYKKKRILGIMENDIRWVSVIEKDAWDQVLCKLLTWIN